MRSKVDGQRAWRSVVASAALVGASCGGGGGEPTETGSAASTTGGDTTAADASTGDPSTGAPTTVEPDPTTGAPGSTSTGGTAGTDTGDDPSSGTDTGVQPPDTVPVFIAQGHHGRRTISCDDGRTWIQNTSEDDAVRCFENGFDCDHNAFAGRGIAYGDGIFVLTWGWGAPGTLVRTRDASQFEVVMSDTPTFADVAFGNGRFVANSSPTRISDDGGATWQEGGPLDIDINTRAIEFIPHDGGVFLVTGESGEDRAIVRSTDGVTWTPASQRPPECGSWVGGIAYGDGVAVLSSNKGFVCRSSDGGDTWEQVPIGESFSSVPIWTGDAFYLYNGATLHVSSDGAQWASEQASPGDVSIGALARSPEGTFVAANAGWMTWYEKQRFFRSEDGKHWEVLPDDAYVGSHPINFIGHGRVEPGAGCPAP